jgi:hypothetical protein
VADKSARDFFCGSQINFSPNPTNLLLPRQPEGRSFLSPNPIGVVQRARITRRTAANEGRNDLTDISGGYARSKSTEASV